jgi:hypothetical protein
MPRRASSSVPLSWIVVGVLILAAAVAGAYLITHKVSDPYRTLSTLDVKAYLENSNSLRGNVYKLSGTVGAQLAWSHLKGRLFSVETDDSNGGDPVPLLIPAELNHVNVQKGQRFIFQVEVIDKGILLAKAISKV